MVVSLIRYSCFVCCLQALGAILFSGASLSELSLSVEIGQLSEPFEVFAFELSKAPDEFGQRRHSVFITNDGRAHALVSWYFPVEPFDSRLDGLSLLVALSLS